MDSIATTDSTPNVKGKTKPNHLEDKNPGGDGNFVINLSGNRGTGSERCDEKQERMCRVCHMESDWFSRSRVLIQLGCRCRNDLGTVHRRCADLWFASKGNRVCEICGVLARNISEPNKHIIVLEQNDVLSFPYTQITAEKRCRSVCSYIGTVTVMILLFCLLSIRLPHGS